MFRPYYIVEKTERLGTAGMVETGYIATQYPEKLTDLGWKLTTGVGAHLTEGEAWQRLGTAKIVQHAVAEATSLGEGY